MTPLIPYRVQIGSWIVSAAAMCWLYARKDDAWFLIGAAGCAAAAFLTAIAARRLASAVMPSIPDDPAQREALRVDVVSAHVRERVVVRLALEVAGVLGLGEQGGERGDEAREATGLDEQRSDPTAQDEICLMRVIDENERAARIHLASQCVGHDTIQPGLGRVVSNRHDGQASRRFDRRGG